LLARRSFPGKNVALTLAIGPYVMPSFALAAGWIILWTRNGFFEKLTGLTSPVNPYGPLSLILILGIHNYPLVLLNVYNALLNLDPSLEEASRIHGVSPLKTAMRVTLPLVTPAVLSGFILSFAYSISEFGAPAALGMPVGYNVMTTAIYSFMYTAPVNYEAAELLSLTLTVFGTSLLVLNAIILRRRKYTVVTGKAARYEAPSRRLYPLALLAVLLALIYLPLASLVFASFIKNIGKPITLDNIGFDNYIHVLSMRRTSASLQASLIASVTAAFAATALGFLVAYSYVRYPGSLGKALDFLVFLPFSIPGLVIGVGLIIAGGKVYPGLYGTMLILILAYIVRFLPYASRTISSVILQIDESLEESARIHGVPFTRVLEKIVLPLTKGALFSGWVLVFNSSMKELSASAILSLQVETALVTAYMMFSEGFFGDGTALTSIVMFTTLLVTALASKMTKKSIVEMA